MLLIALVFAAVLLVIVGPIGIAVALRRARRDGYAACLAEMKDAVATCAAEVQQIDTSWDSDVLDPPSRKARVPAGTSTPMRIIPYRGPGS